MQLFDMCVNLTEASFARDTDIVLERASHQSITHILVPGSELEDSKEAIAIASHFNSMESQPINIYTAVGYHPHNAKLWTSNSREALAKLAYNNPNQVKAIGECGLDYNRNFSTHDQQLQAFVEQLELAISLELPVFLHEREAHSDFLTIIKEHRSSLNNLLVHCFTGTQEELEAYLDNGCYIGITGWFCDERRGTHLRELLPLIPNEKLIIETDSPYLIPRDLPADMIFKTNRRRNEPAYLSHLLHSLATCLEQEPDKLAQATLTNGLAFLGIDKELNDKTP